MDALTALQSRTSHLKLIDPAPSANELEQFFAAALRVPDHAQLHPWQFLVFEKETRIALGNIFENALRLKNPDSTEDQLQRAQQMPLRAPLLIAVIAKTCDHPKAPLIEQIISAGCAAYAIELAAHALGFGAVWRTGDFAYDDTIKKSLGLNNTDHIIGFLYIGSIAGEQKKAQPLNTQDYVRNWSTPS